MPLLINTMLYLKNISKNCPKMPFGSRKGVDIILDEQVMFPNITYNLFPERKRFILVTKILDKQFPNHKHTKDSSIYKVSPRILKTAMYQNCYYQMGRCELIFN